MPLPFALNHVNVWLLEDEDGWTLVDAGISNERTKSLWEGVFTSALGNRPVSRMIVTHYHPDHMGLAGWMVERWAARFEAPRTEWLLARLLTVEANATMAGGMTDYYRQAGADAELLERLKNRGHSYARNVSRVPASYERLQEGSIIRIGGRDWRVMVGPGHAPEMACLYSAEAGVLIAADHILPTITPNVSVTYAEPEADPLTDFVQSFPRFRELPDDTLVLPSHGRPFYGLHRRLDELLDHHHERLDLAWEQCAEPKSVVEMTGVLFKRELDTHQMAFAIGEALAHLNNLKHAGRVAAEQGADGVIRYRRT
jgi:glyoxylase-like metal-dependent hydrolase (beta-lactamase superfamily II)